jgi:flagellin-specific chaperone FliS
MANSTVGLRFNVDVGNAQSQVENITKTVAALNKELAKATEEHDYEAIKRVAVALNNATSARGEIIQQANQAQNAQARANMEMQKQNDPFHGMGAWIFQNAAIKITDGIVTAINTAVSAAKMRASGDYTGAAVAYERGMGEMAGNLGGTAVGASIGAIISAITGLPPNIVMPITSQIASSFGQLFGGMSAREKEENLAYSAQYKNALPGIDSLNQNFGGAINRKELGENNLHGLELRERAVNAARGTGLDTEDFIGAMDKTASYGIRDVQQALNMTQTQALWSRFTGADLSTIQKFAGQSMRYGGDAGAVPTAYGGLMAQNVGKGQFSEFLNSMERILEEGIAKGFVKSSEEIAGNMAMLYKLSGNSALWQGEQGAQRLSQMNMAISNATNLQSVDDVISYGVARDIFNSLEEDNPLTEANERAAAFEKKYRGAVYTDSYADVMQILEYGLDPKLLKGQFEAVGRLENGNVAGMIERFKNLYGLNYTGAAQVYGMMGNMGKEGFSEDEIVEKIKKLQETPGMRSDSALLSDTLNSLRNDGIKIGQLEFDNTEIKLLREQAEILARELQKRQSIYGSTEYNRADELIEQTRQDLELNGDFLSNKEKRFIMIGAHIEGQRSVPGFQIANSLTSLSGGETSSNANAQLVGRRFNSEILPYLSENPSTELLDLIYNLQQEYARAVSGITPSRRQIDDNEQERINNAMNPIINVLNRLNATIDRLQTEGLSVNGDIYGELES